jgi:Protein of unknown function (DUF3034)
MNRRCRNLLALSFAAACANAQAGDRLAATGGVQQVEGSGGGGLVPWALVAGLGTDSQWGGSGFCTQVRPAHFRLDSCGLAVGWHDRIEGSFARLRFDLGQTVPGQSIRMDSVGLKLRLTGDAIFESNPWLPQVALGLHYKHNLDFAGVPRALGARRASSFDAWLAATRVWLAGPLGRTWLADVTLRNSEANQFGILGFGGDQGGRHWLAEGSVAAFATEQLIVGAEYRQKPDNLAVFREQRAWDAFVAWVPAKQASITVAYADLGAIANHASERGPYLSLQLAW